MSAISYEQRPPSPALASHVECYWALRGGPVAADAAHGSDGQTADDRTADDEATDDPAAERVLPDGRVEIVFNCGGIVMQTRDGIVHRQPATLLVGPTTRAVLIRPTGEIHMFGIRLRHGGASAVLDAPAAPLTDTMHALDDVAPFPSSLRERLAESPDFAAQVAMVERHLVPRLARARFGESRATAVAVASILATHGAIEISRVASAAGTSTRHLARRFGQDVGMGPKLFARLARFHALLRRVETERPRTLAAAAARAGYVDQSHLVRDFREFAGLPPSAYFRSRHQLTAFFLDLESAGEHAGSSHAVAVHPAHPPLDPARAR